MPRPRARSLLAGDPRLYQIAVLSSLALYGVLRLDLEVRASLAAAILSTSLLTQLAFTRLRRLRVFDPKSALISALSLSLLLRTADPPIAVLAAFVTIASKFTLRWRGKHLFNPTNLGLVAMMLLTGRIWVSPGQWGSPVYFAFLLACLGGLVVNRAARSDVTAAFILFHGLIVFGRAAWLGDPARIPLHQLQSGAFLIFSFFMISDPKTTPDSRAGRILFAFLVAAGAAFVQFVLFRTNGLLWSLAACSLSVPLIDSLFPGNRYDWTRAPHAARREVPHDQEGRPGPGVPARPPRSAIGIRLLRVLRGEGRREALQQGLPGGAGPK